MLKPRHSAFFGTPLDLIFTQLHGKPLIVTGLAADICVQLTAMDASLRGFGLRIPADCTPAETAEAKVEFLRYLERVLRTDIRPVADSKRFQGPSTPQRMDHQHDAHG